MSETSEGSTPGTSQRREEIFRRLKVDSLVTLILQSAQLEIEESMVLEALAQANKDLEVSEINHDRQLKDDGISVLDRSSFQSVIRGVGEIDFGPKREPETPSGKPRPAVNNTRPYLLLDVRLDDDFKLGRIITAVNYPHTFLSRATNFESPHMLAYKNQPGKMIIVYDDEERIAPKVASTLLQRGYENVVLLSGGIKTALKKYPEGLVTGQIPTLKEPTNNGKKKKAQGTSSIIKSAFTKEDLEHLKCQLQYNLLPASSKSRLIKDTSSVKIRNETSRKQREKIVKTNAWR